MFARHASPPPRPALLPAAAGEVQILPNPSSLMSFSPSRDRAKFDAVPPSRCCSEVHERQNGPTIDESIIGPWEAHTGYLRAHKGVVTAESTVAVATGQTRRAKPMFVISQFSRASSTRRRPPEPADRCHFEHQGPLTVTLCCSALKPTPS